jgi:signal transduction histidine kinase
MRRRLILVAAAISLMVTIAFLLPLIVLVRTVARDRAISNAERDANSLAPALSLTTNASDVATAFGNTDSGREGRLTVVLATGEEVGGAIPHDDDLELALLGNSFSASHPGGTAVFVAVTGSTGRTSVVRVWVPDALLTKDVTRATVLLVGLGIVLVLGAIAVSDRLGASMVRPIRRLASAADRLGGGDLEQRVEPEGPAEVAAVAQAFNLLAGRVGELLAAERELVADLSHRLRTPLHVLRLEADSLTDRDASQRLGAAVDDLEAAVTGLIEEARRPIRSGVGARADLAAVAQSRVTFWRVLAEDQGRPLRTELAGGPIYVAATAAELEAALDALLGNVFEHTPDGTAFAVTLHMNGESEARLTIDDAGAGIEDTDLERGRSGRRSTGLGLDIARRTVEAAGGGLRIARSELGGASISLTLPSSTR